MQCIYFDGEKCLANPRIPALVGIYKPTQEDKQNYCTTGAFNTCPRCVATVEYMKANPLPSK